MTPISLTLPTNTLRVLPPVPTINLRRDFLTPIPELPGEALLVIDNSSLEKVKRCHAAGAYYLVNGREPHARNAALTFGGAIHAGLELFHRAQWLTEQVGGEEKQCEFLSMNLDSWKGQACSPEAQDTAIVSHFTNNPAPPDEFRTLANALEVLKHYRSQCNPLLHPDYEWEICADDSGPIIERAFELPLCVLEGEWTWKGEAISRIHVAWSGRVDLLASINGRVRVVDNKTSSIDGDQFIQSFQLSSQTIGYVWAAKQLWPELAPSGFCLNVLRLKKPAIGQGLLDKGSRGGEPPLRFFRAYFDYTEGRLAEWQSDTILFIEDFLHSLSRGQFPLNDRHCYDKFGRCPYHDVCLIDDVAVRSRFLESDAFKPVTWNPTAH